MGSEFIECVDCHKEFEHDGPEHEFFAQKGYDKPKRCKDCRIAKKKRFGDRPRNE